MKVFAAGAVALLSPPPVPELVRAGIIALVVYALILLRLRAIPSGRLAGVPRAAADEPRR